MLKSSMISEIHRIHLNTTRSCHSASQSSVRSMIETILRKGKFKDHAMLSILNALQLQKYTQTIDSVLKCFDMDREVVCKHLIEIKWHRDAADMFVEYVWFDRLSL